MLFLKKIKNFWCCHKNIVVLWQNKEEWHKASIAIQRLTQNGEAELYRHPLKTLPMALLNVIKLELFRQVRMC